jgi:hypothetical protein
VAGSAVSHLKLFNLKGENTDMDIVLCLQRDRPELWCSAWDGMREGVMGGCISCYTSYVIVLSTKPLIVFCCIERPHE